MTLCSTPGKVMSSVLLYFLSITASIFNANICYTPWSPLILAYCTELTIVSSYICELHIRIPTARSTNDYSVQSGSKHRWHAVKKFCLFKLLSKFIHTLMIYLTTMSVTKAIASSDGVISKQCQTGCDAIWSVTNVPRQNYTMEITVAEHTPN